MNEASYIRAVHRHLPPAVYAWKIADRFRRGVPDTWYSGDRADLWAEYKFLTATPVRGFTPRLSAQQVQWLTRRHQEGRQVAVIVGTPDGGTVIPPDGLAKKALVETWLSHKEIARWIAQTVS